jgi:hypothetical protein
MRLIASTDDFQTWVGDWLVAQVWTRETTLAGVDELRRAVDERVAAHRKIFVLIVTDKTCRPPSWEARDRIAQVMRQHKDTIEACALVFEGTGLAAATIRGVVAGLNMLARHPFPYRVFATLPDALDWCGTFPLGRQAASSLKDAAAFGSTPSAARHSA